MVLGITEKLNVKAGKTLSVSGIHHFRITSHLLQVQVHREYGASSVCLFNQVRCRLCQRLLDFSGPLFHIPPSLFPPSPLRHHSCAVTDARAAGFTVGRYSFDNPPASSRTRRTRQRRVDPVLTLPVARVSGGEAVRSFQSSCRWRHGGETESTEPTEPKTLRTDSDVSV